MKKRILAVDDNATNILLYEELLEDDFILETAIDGQDALVKAFEFLPDIILLDIMMPGIDGYQVCEKLKGSEKLSDCNIILVSAKNTTEDRIKGYDSGADDYLIKPFNEQELFAKLQIYSELKHTQEIDRFKSDVISLFSYEARTPLTDVLGPLHILKTKNDLLSAEERMKWLELMEKSTHHLLQFIDRASQLSQLRTGTYPLKRDKYTVSQLVEKAMAEQNPLAEIKGINLTFDNVSDVVIEGDAQLLQESISGMIENAIQHSEPNSDVSVISNLIGKKCSIKVFDTGSGIDWKDIPHIFDGLYDSGTSKNTKGHQLSLAIAKEVVTLHHGEIHATSNASHGTEFEINIPIAA